MKNNTPDIGSQEVFGKYWEDYKIKRFFINGKAYLSIECSYLGTREFEGKTFIECIGKAIDAGVQMGWEMCEQENKQNK